MPNRDGTGSAGKVEDKEEDSLEEILVLKNVHVLNADTKKLLKEEFLVPKRNAPNVILL
jgi:hypothetical protein